MPHVLVVGVGERPPALPHQRHSSRRSGRARRLRPLTAAIAFAALAFAAPASAAPTPAPVDFYGANVQGLLRGGWAQPPSYPGYLDTMAQSGLGIARFDAPWMWAEQVPPVVDGTHVYSWKLFDQTAEAFARQGIRWLAVIDLPPKWAQGNGQGLLPEHYADFGAFAAAFAARYGTNGSFWGSRPDLPALPVTDYEVWSEANSALFWQATPNAAEYLAAFRQVRLGIESADPSARVLVSLGWQNFDDYMRALYAAGGKGQTDGVAFHPYAPTARGVAVLTRKLRDILTMGGEPDLPIEMTEIGWPRAPDGAGASSAFKGYVGDASRAATTALSADALAASDCNVKNYIVYSLVEEQRNSANPEDWLGVIDRNGQPTETLNALVAAAHRHAARPASLPMLPICSGPTFDRNTASSPMRPRGAMPLNLSAPPSPGGCMTPSVTYYGDPLEEASVFVRQYRGGQRGAVTDATGTTKVCLARPTRTSPYLLWARVGAMAVSPVFSCTPRSCKPINCTKASLRLDQRRLSRRRLKLSIATRCGKAALFDEPVKVAALDRKGNPRSLSSFFTPPSGRTFVVKLDPRRDRRLRIRFSGDPTFQLPAIVRTVKFARAGRKASRGRRAAG